MGRSFTTAHIHNSDGATKASFKKAFSDVIRSKGYTLTDVDNASLSYTLVFSKDRKWVTVLSEDMTDVRKDTAELAKSLKTYAVMVELVDSDFAELSLFDDSGSHIDTLTLGESYLGNDAPLGEPQAWQPLLTVGVAWGEVNTIQKRSYTFAEEALHDFAPLIGMDSENIQLDSDCDTDDMNAVVLHFKHAKEKKLTLNTAFAKVFGEYLEPLGFVKIKGRATFVRVVNNEFVHIITCRRENNLCFTPPIDKNFPITHDMNCFEKIYSYDDPYLNQHYVRFDVYCNVRTLYDRILLDNPFPGSINVLNMYRRGDIRVDTPDYHDKIWSFSYEKNNEQSLIAEMLYTLELTKRHILPTFENVDNYESCIAFSRKYIMGNIPNHWYLKLGNYQDNLNEWFEKRKKENIYNYEHGKIKRNNFNLEKYLKRFREVVDEDIQNLDNIMSNEERYNELFIELEEMKRRTVKALLESGIEIKE